MSNTNTGYWNTGYWNTGDRNTGDRNTGDWNTGNWNTGDWNTGNWNTGNWNTGNCNTIDPNIMIFNKETSFKIGEIEFPDFFYFDLTEWISESEMNDKEKDAYPSYVTCGGYLKCYEYKQAWRNSWDKASKEDRDKVKELPNFDKDVFYEISGIKVDEDNKRVISMEEIAKKFDIDVKDLKIKK